MIRTALVALAALALPTNVHLATDYSSDRSLKIESNFSMKLETSNMEMTVDGQPVDRPGGGGDMSSESTRKIVVTDHWKGHEGGKLSKVERSFDDISAKSTMHFGDNSRDMEQESPLKGVTLALEKNDKGEVDVKVASGDKPKEEEALQGHRLELALDALLPGDDKAAKASWDLENEAIKRALGFDLQKSIFPPAREEGGADAGGRGGRGGGPRGGMRGGPGGGGGRVFELAEFSGKATLSSEEEEHDGVKCAVIEVAIQAKGELPEQQWGGGRGRRGDAFDPSESFATFGSNYTVKLEGKLYYDRAEKRPAGLELEGTLRIDTDTEREMRDSKKMHMKSTQEGEIKASISVKKGE